MMDSILKDISFANFYLGVDVLFSRTEEDHMQKISIKFSVISKLKLPFNIANCEVVKKVVHLSGHIAVYDGIRISPEKVESIKKAPSRLDSTLL